VEDDENNDARERLRASFLQFRKHVEPLAAEVSQSVPGYTDHSIIHCDALWDTASLITGSDYPLTPAEAFVLGGAFLIHDLAMGLAAYSEGLPGILQSQAWKDLLWAHWSDLAPELQSQALADVDQNPTWDGLTSREVKASLTTFLRESHAAEAEDILAREWRLRDEEPFFLLPDTDLRHWYGELIGQIARSHWLDVQALEEYLPGTRGTPSGLPLDWTVDPVKVACILRVADAAQIDSRRAQPLHTPHRNPQGESKEHWAFQERMLRPRLDASRLEFTSSRAFRPDEADAWWLAYDTVAMVHRELQGVDSLCADLGKPRMVAKGAAGAEDPKRFARYVPTAHWQPIDARPHIDNPLGIIESLGGEALYGSRGTIPLRELLANAVDASRARKSVQGEGGHLPPVQVQFERTADVDFLHIRDFGIGMSPETIVDYLCNFGTSGWTSSDFRREYPGAMAAGYASTGKFGIGFFSAFMVAKRVRVITRPLLGGWNDTHVLEFREGLQSRPVLRKAEASERLSEPGTLVTLWLDTRVDESSGMLYGERYLDESAQVGLVERLAFTSDHGIELIPLYSTRPVCVTRGDAWQDRSPAEIYDVLHSDPWILASAETTETGRSFFEKFLTPLHGKHDEIIGNLAFTTRGREDWMAPASCYCGGFQSTQLYELTGVAVGRPVRASRDRLRLDVDIDQMQSWVNSHWERIRAAPEFTDSDRMQFHWFARGFEVDLPEVPLGVSKEGLLTSDQIAAWISSRDSFKIARIQLGSAVDMKDQGFWFSSWEGLLQVNEDSIAVGYGARRPNDEFPLPACDEFEKWINSADSTQPVPRPMLWWLNNHYQPDSAVLRLAAQAWDLPLLDVVSAMHVAGIDDGVDTRPQLVSYNGPNVRTGGLIVARPGHPAT